ncbi:hypothetical protein Tco_0818121 [Tanacetum coccineum]
MIGEGLNGTEDIGGSVVPEEVTKEVVQQPEKHPELRKEAKELALQRILRLFSVLLIDRNKKEATNDEMDSIMDNNTWRLADLPPGCKPLMDVKTTFLNGELEEEVVLTKGFLVIKDLYEGHRRGQMLSWCIRIKHENTPMDTSEKLMPNNGQAVSQLEYSRVIGCLMYDMTCTRPDIAFTVGKLSGYTSNLGTQYWQSNSDGNTEDILSSSDGEAKWLRNLILEIPLWSKPIAPISIRCDSVVTLAKTYSQMYNRKSRHLGVRHSMIRELIKNGVISIEFARSQQNIADYLTKGLARDLVIKSTEGMCLKSN